MKSVRNLRRAVCLLHARNRALVRELAAARARLRGQARPPTPRCSTVGREDRP